MKFFRMSWSSYSVCGEEGVRLAQKVQAGPRISMGIQW
jgi:hypothetical protein